MKKFLFDSGLFSKETQSLSFILKTIKKHFAKKYNQKGVA